MWQVIIHPLADGEFRQLPTREQTAMLTAIEKLLIVGPALSFPHQSSVRGAQNLRELRPRAGRSAWRAFYRRVGAVFVIAAIGPEAEADRRGFERAKVDAVARLDDGQTEGGET